MPCYDPRSEPSYVLAEAEKRWRHNSPIAELLCKTLKRIPEDQIKFLSADVQQWWVEHQERDKRAESKREGVEL